MPSPHRYIQDGISSGHDRSMLVRAQAYQQAISSNGAVPILTLKHLARETGTEWGYLRSIVGRRINEYQPIRRRKRDGTFRDIASPNPALMNVQRWILRNVLTGLKIHRASFAYSRGLSIRHCAEAHVGARWLLKLDLHDFFGSIDESRIYRVVRELGYPKLAAFEIGRICTRPKPSVDPSWAEGRGVEAYDSARLGVLPQGAPTSGALANAVAFRLDTLLAQIAGDRGLVYTRYSDDLTFSSSDQFSRTAIPLLVREVERTIVGAGLQPHRKKTRVVPPGARQIVLGLMLHDGGVRLLPEFRDRLDNHIRCVGRYGPAAHARVRAFDSALSMMNHVDGCLAFAEDIEPDWAADRKERWNAALDAHGHPIDRDT